MKLKFRQGVVKFPLNLSGQPDYLQKNSDNAYIDLMNVNGPVTITAAHFNANYLITEQRVKEKAWGPLIAIGQTQYLYWDISLLTGNISYGYTTLPPFTNALPPSSPQVDQHWFDLTTSSMKVWNGTKWLIKIRVFAATYDQNAILIQRPKGSQVGLNNVEVEAGNILIGKNGQPLRDSDGTFVTSETEMVVSHTSGENVKVDSAVQLLEAVEFIPGFSLITVLPNGKMGLASHLNTNHFVVGMVRRDVSPGEVSLIVQGGLILNEDWDFSTAISKPIFCGMHGQVTLTPPLTGINQLIGFVHSANSIMLNILNPTRL